MHLLVSFISNAIYVSTSKTVELTLNINVGVSKTIGLAVNVNVAQK